MGTLSQKEFTEIFPCFRTGPDALIRDILTVSRHETFPGGLHLYSEGDTCAGIAFLLSGEIRIYKVGESGREITLYEIGRGETCILNASCILSNTPYPAEAETITGGEMLVATAADFRRLVALYGEMREFICRLLSSRLTSMMTLLEEVAFGKMEQRLQDYLIEKSGDGRLTTTHQKIAADLGTSREVVSRLLKDFERRGKVVLSRNLIELVNL